MRLFHFSDDPNIVGFKPRPVRVPAERPAGMEWLNGPLVWAIDELHESMYLFPRECPRILLWRTPDTIDEDHAHWFGQTEAKIIAYIEQAWHDRLCTETLYRYELSANTFEDIDDAGMWISREPIEPIRIDRLTDLPRELEIRAVELRILDRLTPLKNVWQTSLHASGIRLRNAQDWGKPGWTHSKPGRTIIIE